MNRATLRRLAPDWVRHAWHLLTSANARHNAVHERRRRRAGRRPTPPSPLRTVMVICHGNICRSPFAERLLATGHPEFEVRSAGLEAREGKPAEPGALRTARDYAMDLSDHGAHRLNDEDVAWADWILAMEGHQIAKLLKQFPAAAGKSSLLGDFLEEPPFLITDPWGSADQVFRDTFVKIHAATEGIAKQVGTPD